MKCKWNLTSSLANYTIVVSRVSFGLGDGDSLFIYSSAKFTNQIAELTDTNFGGPYNSNNTISLQLITDGSIVGMGFSLLIKQIQLVEGCCTGISCVRIPKFLDAAS